MAPHFPAGEQKLPHKPTTLLGVTFDNLDYDGVLARADTAISDRQFLHIVPTNVDSVMKLRRDAAFREVYRGASLVVADGVPLLWAAAWCGQTLKGRVNGTDLFERLAAHAATRAHSMFLLGGNGDAAARAAAELVARHPGLRIAGVYAPPFGFERDPRHNEMITEMIRTSGADILVVGLGAPKQEKWIAAHGRATGAAVALCVGFSFSFVGGLAPRAPRWMQTRGLEWLWRLGHEPRRLWRRYLVDDLPFFALIARQIFDQRVRAAMASTGKA